TAREHSTRLDGNHGTPRLWGGICQYYGATLDFDSCRPQSPGLRGNRTSLTMSALSSPFFIFLSSLFLFRAHYSLHSCEWSCSFHSSLHRRPRLVRNLSVGFIPTQTS